MTVNANTLASRASVPCFQFGSRFVRTQSFILFFPFFFLKRCALSETETAEVPAVCSKAECAVRMRVKLLKHVPHSWKFPSS